jgi:hypothetical protein
MSLLIFPWTDVNFMSELPSPENSEDKDEGDVENGMEMDVDAEVWVVAHAWVEEEEVVGGEDGEGIMVYEPCPDYIPSATPSLSQNSSCA